MYDEFLNNIKNKYNYDDSLMKAIEITIPIMVDTYGDNNIEQILNLFNNVKIFSTSDMSKENRDRIENEMIGSIKENIISEESNPYGTNIDPGAYYSYEPLFDSNMNVSGEVRWLVTNNGEKYKELFGTTINMPYFLHELNHAFAMQNAAYKKEGNRIVSKHGMFSEIKEFDLNNENKVFIKNIFDEDIILEEMINEMYTQRQLTKLLNKNEYREVHEELRKINHVPTSYSTLLITFAENMEKLIGRDSLLDYRLNNNMSIKEEFNNLCMQSDIYNKYLYGKNPWEYFSQKIFEIFELSSNGFKYDHEDYVQKQRQLLVEAFSVLSSYRQIKEGTIDLQEFENRVSNILNPQEQTNSEAKKI